MLPTYDHCLKCSHTFNLLNARGAISVAERTSYIGRVRNLARLSAEGYLRQREALGYPLLNKVTTGNGGRPMCKGTPPQGVNVMGKELLLEIGTEEIPAAFLPKALGDMEEIIGKELAENRIRHGEIRTMATPRRLFLAVDDVAERQDDQVIEKLGPARRVAFDEAGNPSKAALGFARGQCIDVNALEVATTEKGEYLCARKKIAGEATEGLLPAILTRLITGIPFRKSMRWSDLEIRFARPIHWILALYGGRIVPFRIGNIESGDTSRGHRFMNPAPFPFRSFEEYLAQMRAHFVIVDPAERKKIIRDETEKAAAAVGGKPLRNDELLEQVAFLTEYPTVVCGNFDFEYLKLPREVLVTTMISHQKYFPVVDGEGNLLPHFLTINNTLARDPAVVQRGNEKVIRARLADARFFFEEDRKIPLANRVEGLKKVTFHTLLGTSYEKVIRFRMLAGRIARRIESAPGDNAAFLSRVDEAAFLAKADLDTLMVCEFAELQGIMGREYALLEGKDPIVAKAIYEHYLPTAAGGDLPGNRRGRHRQHRRQAGYDLRLLRRRPDPYRDGRPLRPAPSGPWDHQHHPQKALVASARHPDRRKPRHPRGAPEAPRRRGEGRRPGVLPGSI